MNIKWVLCEFHEPKVSEIIDQILKKTKETSMFTYGNLLTKRKEDLDIIYKILTDEYLKKREVQESLPNMFEETVKYQILISDKKFSSEI